MCEVSPKVNFHWKFVLSKIIRIWSVSPTRKLIEIRQRKTSKRNEINQFIFSLILFLGLGEQNPLLMGP
jgi:hypothetical protein